jgi:hypothetical protein
VSAVVPDDVRELALIAIEAAPREEERLQLKP